MGDIRQQHRNSGKEYAPTSFCWVCGRKLWHKNKPVIKEVDGLPRTMHKFCSQHIEWMSEAVKEGENE